MFSTITMTSVGFADTGRVVRAILARAAEGTHPPTFRLLKGA
jgi:hypothetical protein